MVEVDEKYEMKVNVDFEVEVKVEKGVLTEKML